MKSQIQALRDQSPPQRNGQITELNKAALEQQKFTFKNAVSGGLEPAKHSEDELSSRIKGGP